MMKPWLAASAMIALAGCQSIPAAKPASVAAADHDTIAFAEAACGSCHAVEAHGLSPNPQAPEWPVIANREGVTAQTLASWLRDAHNYPEQMDFYLDDDEVEQLARYIMTLRREGYTPPPS